MNNSQHLFVFTYREDLRKVDPSLVYKAFVEELDMKCCPVSISVCGNKLLGIPGSTEGLSNREVLLGSGVVPQTGEKYSIEVDLSGLSDADVVFAPVEVVDDLLWYRRGTRSIKH